METGELNFCHVFCSCLFIAASSLQLKKCAKCWDKFPINICVQKCRVSWGYRMATFIAETGATRFKECRQFISTRLPLHHCVLSIVPKLGVVPSQRCGVRLKLPPFRGYFWCGFAKAFALSAGWFLPPRSHRSLASVQHAREQARGERHFGRKKSFAIFILFLSLRRQRRGKNLQKRKKWACCVLGL